jgi:hypothetical protein
LTLLATDERDWGDKSKNSKNPLLNGSNSTYGNIKEIVFLENSNRKKQKM